MTRISVQRNKDVGKRDYNDYEIKCIPRVFEIRYKTISQNLEDRFSRKDISKKRISDRKHILQLFIGSVPIHCQENRVDDDTENDENFEHFGTDDNEQKFLETLEPTWTLPGAELILEGSL